MSSLNSPFHRCLFACVLCYSDYLLATNVAYDQIPLSSANEDLQPVLAAKRRILALNKKDLANPNIMNVRLGQALDF